MLRPRLLAFAAAMLIASLAAHAQTYSILYNFGGGSSGTSPYDGLTMDHGGSFYGVTPTGGSSGQGVVFKLYNHNGSWLFTPLYSFRGGNDGARPYGRVAIGPDGSLYGATIEGGMGGSHCRPGGCGTIYKLRPPARPCGSISCPWSETLLHRFSEDPVPLNSPYGHLIADAAGNLYGTAYGGGTGNCSDSGCGGVFELARSGGSWNFSVIYNLTGLGDGTNPTSGLTMDSAGNLFGTTSYAAGFFNGYGTVFELLRSGGGWTQKTLYTFQGGSDGGSPYGGVVFDSAGNLYGATSEAQQGQLLGVAYKLTPAGSGWDYSVISNLTGSVEGDLALDSNGNLYGTATFGGGFLFGYVFKLSNSDGAWTQTSLHDFTTDNHDGILPWSSVAIDAAGNLYGTTNGGGTTGAGVIWQIVP